MLVDASVDGQRVWVIVDTGSQITVGQQRAAPRARAPRPARADCAGRDDQRHRRPISTAEYGIARRIRIGGLDINNLPVAFADVHPFRQLDLTDRPALLLGMDALQLFDRVSVDFANRRVRLLPRRASRDSDVRLAAR